MDWLNELNPAQREAVTCPDGPVLVIAGAGTGKTKTLASRVAWLIEQGTPADRILLLTFTRRAAAEMLGRAARFAGAQANKVWGGTFHATANRLLRLYGRAVGLSATFTVMDQADSEDLMNLIRGELGLAKAKKRFPRKGTLSAIYSRMVNSRMKLKAVLQAAFPWCEDDIDGIRAIFEAYVRRKREQNVLDYDDLLLHWQALMDAPEVGDKVAGRFDHVLVDEYQDTNVVQAEILVAMRRRNGNIMVVGDDAQSIYSFRSATVRNMLDFPRQFPKARTITLEENYRSVQPILDASNAVMEQAGERYTKNLFTRRQGGEKPALVTYLDETEQCNAVCDRILARREEGVPLMRQAVLFRAGHHSAQLEVELTRRNIPFVKYGGLKFVEAAHVKDLIAILRILENPADQMSWYRVLLLMPGVGPAAARKLMAGLGIGGDGGGAGNPLRALQDAPPKPPPAAEKAFQVFRSAMRNCTTGKVPPAAQVERIRRFYEPIFERVYENPKVRLRDLDQLELIASNYRSRSKFITDLTLDPPRSTGDLAGKPLLDDDYLILSTIHSAKGCEWDAVYIIHAADGMIPSDMATGSAEEIDEERRLLYVAMTRAKDSLGIFFPLRYYHRGRGLSDAHSYAQVSRFLADVQARLFARSTAGAQQDEEHPAEDAGQGGSRTVDDKLRDLWSG